VIRLSLNAALERIPAALDGCGGSKTGGTSAGRREPEAIAEDRSENRALANDDAVRGPVEMGVFSAGRPRRHSNGCLASSSPAAGRGPPENLARLEPAQRQLRVPGTEGIIAAVAARPRRISPTSPKQPPRRVAARQATPDEDAPRAIPVTASSLLVIGLTILAGSLHILVLSHRTLWLDEACTYWTIQVPALDLLRGVRTDGSPPLYFLVVSAVSQVFGTSEVALRLASMAAATALVPACYAVTRRFASPRTALIAAGLVTVSPLVHYYSVEARSYALLQLETAAILYAALRVLGAPRQWRWWLVLTLALTVQLWTHTYAVFLVALSPFIFWLVSPRQRIAVGLRASAAAGAAAFLALPVVLTELQNSGSGVMDWVAVCWQRTPPSAAVFRSLEVFGFGGVYPVHLSSLGPMPSVRWLSVTVTTVLLVAAVVPLFKRDPRRTPYSVAPYVVTQALLAFLLLPLFGAWLYSQLGQPLYVVGRYDTIVLPVFLILMAVGLDNVLRIRWWLGVPICVVLLGFSMASFVSAVSGTTLPPSEEDRVAATHIAAQAAPTDLIVTTGYRRAVLAYYLDRAGHPANVLSFPAETANHPGWYSADRLLAHPGRLAQEGQHLVAKLESHARQGARVWIVASGDNEVDAFLLRPLVSIFAPDGSRSSQDCAVLCLELR
jgi:uncharacterized membrane protein